MRLCCPTFVFAHVLAVILLEREKDAYQGFIDKYPVLGVFDYQPDLPAWTKKFGPHYLQGLPGLIDRFEWVINPSWFGIPEVRRSKNPSSVFASPHLVPYVLEVAETDFNDTVKNRMIVIKGNESCLSQAFSNDTSERAGNITLLLKHFDRIFYQVKDVEIPGIKVMPLGLHEPYLRNDAWKAAEFAMRNASVHHKPRNVLAAWGRYWKTEGKVEPSQNLAHESRNAARRWLDTEAAQEAGAEAMDLAGKQWWHQLSHHRFLLVPFGTAIGRPTVIEALLVLTIPIALRGPFPLYDELVRYGFPVVVLEDWSEITLAKLNGWWQELSPRLESFRDNCLTADAYWRYFIGEVDHCE